jgi:hypothetical protein
MTVKEINLKILTDLYVFTPLNMNALFLACRLSACIYVRMTASLAPEGFDEFY